MNTLKEDYPWWRRFQIQFAFDWRLFPGDSLVRKWLWECNFHCTWIGKKVINPSFASPRGYSTQETFDQVKEGDKTYYIAKFFWMCGSFQFFGISPGFGIYYTPIPEEIRKRYAELENEKRQPPTPN